MSPQQVFYPVSALADALASSVPVLTPNQRLARRIKAAWGRHQIELKRSAWETPPVMTLDHWWLRCYQEALRAGAELPELATVNQQRALWRQVVQLDSSTAGLLRPVAAAQLAQEAYDNLLLWDVEWRDRELRQQFEFFEDSSLFLQWAEAFEAGLQAAGLTTLPALVPALSEQTHSARLVLAEFAELAPRYQHALDRMADTLEYFSAHDRRAVCSRVSCETPYEELRSAAEWAYGQHQSSPGRKLAILLPSLQQERQHIERELRRQFGSNPRRPDSLPVNFSAGQPLASCGPVVIALQLLRSPVTSLSLAQLTALCTTRYRPRDQSDHELSALRLLQEQAREPVTLAQFRSAMLRTGGEALAEESVATCSLLPLSATDPRSLRSSRRIAEWLPVLRSLLTDFGWPGPGPLDSIEYQQVTVFQSQCQALLTLDPVLGKVSYEQAVAALEQLCNDTVFQAETPDAPIQVLGMLEAAGLAFDAVWICGMGAGQFPAAASPNPLLPVSLQRNLRMPHADASRELAYAEGLLAQLQAASDTLIASYARSDQDADVPPSPLIADFIPQQSPVNARHPQNWLTTDDDPLEAIVDVCGPGVSDDEAGELSGGSAILRDQAQCPFRAFVRHRLSAEPLPEPEAGLTAAERGSLLHAALFQLWGELQTSEALRALTTAQREQATAASVNSAIAGFRHRRNPVIQALLDVERQRLTTLIGLWLEIELQRPPFAVIAREEKVTLQLGSLPLRLRLDRVDQLAGGEQLIIDYKSGNSRPRHWLGERLEEPQLPLYATVADEVAALGVSFAVLRPDALEFRGLAALDFGPGIDTDIAAATAKTDLQAKDWNGLLEAWRSQLEGLVQEFLNGYAVVNPDATDWPSRYCTLGAMCRVRS